MAEVDEYEEILAEEARIRQLSTLKRFQQEQTTIGPNSDAPTADSSAKLLFLSLKSLFRSRFREKHLIKKRAYPETHN